MNELPPNKCIICDNHEIDGQIIHCVCCGKTFCLNHAFASLDDANEYCCVVCYDNFDRLMKLWIETQKAK